MKMKKAAMSVLSLLLVLMLSFSAFAEGDVDIDIGEPDNVATEVMISNMAGQYKTQGRTSIISGNLSLDYTASGFEFNANCQGDVSVTFNASGLNTADGGGMYFSIRVDGTELSPRTLASPRSTAFISANGDTTLKIATALPQGVHNFKIYRSTEIERGIVSVKSVTLTGGLTAKPADKNLFIEFVGDSITTGYGNLATSAINSSSVPSSSAPIYQDGTQTYAFKTATELDADFSMVAQQGIGAFVGWQADHNTIDVYPYTRYIRDRSTLWNFSRQPNIVVINLGTNDIGTYNKNGHTYTLEDVKTGFKTLINLIRQKNPNAKIVWAHGMMTPDADSLVTQVVADVRSGAGGITPDLGVYEVKLSQNNGGGGNHPNADGQGAAATDLENYLRTNFLSVTTPTVTNAGYTAGTWTKNDVTFTLSGATYLSGIAKYQYSTDNGSNWNDITNTNGTITKDGNNNVTQVLFPVTSGVNTYSFRAVSGDGQNSAATTGVNVKIDKVVPVVGVSAGTYTAGAWTKNDVVFTLSNTATNGSGQSYKYSTNGTTWNDITGSTFTVSADANASYTFKAVSGAGIESTVSDATAVKVQKTLPANATVVLNPADPDTGASYKTAPTITLTAPTITGTAPVTTYYKLWAGTEPADGTVFTGTNQPTITVDGDYTLKVWTVDEAGNASADLTKTIRVNANATGVIPGDINNDGNVDLIDVTMLSRHVAGWSSVPYQPWFDVSGDGKVDLIDVTLLSRSIAGWNVVLH